MGLEEALEGGTLINFKLQVPVEANNAGQNHPVS